MRKRLQQANGHDQIQVVLAFAALENAGAILILKFQIHVIRAECIQNHPDERGVERNLGVRTFYRRRQHLLGGTHVLRDGRQLRRAGSLVDIEFDRRRGTVYQRSAPHGSNELLCVEFHARVVRIRQQKAIIRVIAFSGG